MTGEAMVGRLLQTGKFYLRLLNCSSSLLRYDMVQFNIVIFRRKSWDPVTDVM